MRSSFIILVCIKNLHKYELMQMNYLTSMYIF